MESVEVCLLKYRHAIREMLYKAGVVTNLGSTDNELLDHLSQKLAGVRIIWERCDACGARFPHPMTLEAHRRMDHSSS